jgi:N-methylhydantoinase A
VPRVAGAFCALGMLHSDVRHDLLRVHFGRLDRPDEALIQRGFGQLEEETRSTLTREGFAPEKTVLQRALDLRYLGQQWDITVALSPGPLNAAAIRRDFEAEHDRLFGHIQPGGSIEITKLRVAGIGRLPPLALAAPPRAMGPAVCAEQRQVWVDQSRGWQDVPIYRGTELAPGHTMVGPAIVDEQTTTVLVGPGDTLTVDAAGNFAIEIGREG